MFLGIQGEERMERKRAGISSRGQDGSCPDFVLFFFLFFFCSRVGEKAWELNDIKV